MSWVCIKEKTQRYKGNININFQYEVLQKTEHSCVSNVAEIEVYRKLETCRKRAREKTLVPVPQIFQELSELYKKVYGFVTKIPTYSNAKIVLSHFWLNGYVNKQNCRIWREANPQVYVGTPLHSDKLTVWCALWAGGIIGPYFKNDEGHNVTVNGDQYRAMITNFFIPELNNHDLQELWFQQDGAACHTARATIDLLKDTFGDRLISPFGPVNWPPRSCDLTPLDYFL
ncbi:putative transposase [Trichonephila clavipes]|nr:putative transposase [Trichonephila clavipes]